MRIHLISRLGRLSVKCAPFPQTLCTKGRLPGRFRVIHDVRENVFHGTWNDAPVWPLQITFHCVGLACPCLPICYHGRVVALQSSPKQACEGHMAATSKARIQGCSADAAALLPAEGTCLAGSMPRQSSRMQSPPGPISDPEPKAQPNMGQAARKYPPPASKFTPIGRVYKHSTSSNLIATCTTHSASALTAAFGWCSTSLEIGWHVKHAARTQGP